ncbi:DUF4129 domain-containing protein [Alicyclobacillus fastidiosus]|uniref:DUF4129 domain-containing protein n=1 Tax=Alicyclobacillus fastidiosus TaxID=392011 RepID=A0ABY6ZL61_9BACL|nr:DUF4129 domain-containing protein [Alicyclobacillus fastidiosus]WAH43602.1 DUF4129 domain-containing protein [Alicyclobacillus fastidiosus]GMA59788.1 hypothetical protein GCM10025859_02280 [Alicyclobacillus fastidiosus]
MNQTTDHDVTLSQPTGCSWRDLSDTAHTWTGILNGLAGFYFAVTFSWAHQSWPVYLLVPLICCICTGVAMTVILRFASWRKALILATVVDLVLLGASEVILRAPVGMAIATLFGAVASAALALPHVLQADVGDGCIINLRIFTGLAVAGVVIYILNDVSSAAARSASAILFTVVMSIGLLLGELGLARHAQAKSTGLAQRAVLYSGAGVLTLAALVGGLGPIAAGATILILLAALAFIVTPVMSPVMQALFNLLNRLKLHGHTGIQRAPSTAQNTTSHTLTHAHVTSPTLQWAVWAVLLGIMLTGVLIYLLVQRKKETPTVADQAKLAMTTVKRDRQIDGFQLEPTADPTRRAYQKRLQEWHAQGHTIGRSETVRELFSRLPTTEVASGDLSLTQAYERVRYGLGSNGQNEDQVNQEEQQD